MGQLVGVLLGTVFAVGAFFLIFWSINRTIELAPTQWALFLGVVGFLIGLVLGAFLNANAFGGGLATVLGGGAVGAALGALWGWIRPPSVSERKRFSEAAQPWIFIGPALLFVSVGLIIPTIRTGILAFKDRTSENWVGFENFNWIFTNDEMFNMSGWTSIFTNRLFLIGVASIVVGVWVARRYGKEIGERASYDAPWPVGWTAVGVTFIAFAVFTTLRGVIWNNLWWVFAVTAFATGLGLFIAVLTDRMRRGETVAKAIIFLPMAISMVGASVIWRFIYIFRPEGEVQIGVANAVVTAAGADPVAWLIRPPWNTFFLIIVLIWIQTGFAMVVLSAAIKSVPSELLEAAEIDGATTSDSFWRITIPTIRSTIAVVITTLVVIVMKVYDIVKVMTNGEFQTNVIANEMFDQAFRFTQAGRGSALATVLFLFILPIMYVNIRRVRKEGAMR
jgi:alpha-glucoside transport system permease protein